LPYEAFQKAALMDGTGAAANVCFAQHASSQSVALSSEYWSMMVSTDMAVDATMVSRRAQKG
jgi:hypothetical protein